MNPDTLQLLRSVDDPEPENCESPPGFNWTASMKRVRSLKPELEQIVGRHLDIDENVQDASFFTELAAHVPGEDSIETAITIIFSAFGGLFTIWSSMPNEIPEAAVQKAVDAVQRHGFRYVDTESLEEAYCGTNPVFQHSRWIDRFFSYI